MLLGITAVIVGLASGVGIWLFKALIELAQSLFFGQIGGALAALGRWTVAILPVLGGLVVGLIAHFFIGQERHHGVAGIIESVALAGGRLRYRRIPAKSVAAAVSIGSGASVGPEDPSVQIGANLGSMLGQWFRLSDERVRALVASGAAAGIAAAFNAPIAGIFFAVELILGEISAVALEVIVLAAVVSAVFTQAVAGPQPAFSVPPHPQYTLSQLPIYLALGLLAGPVAAAYIRLLYRAHDLFHAWPAPRWLKPAAAGLVVGAFGIFLPQVFGVGYATIETILAGEDLALGLLVALLVAKLFLTPLSIGGGFFGGVFAPSLFLGATLGAACGVVGQTLLPGLGLTSSAVAMVGMAAVLAGAVRAPLTAIMLVFEMTNDYRIVLPAMMAVVVSLVLARRLQRDSVYEASLARKGIRIERGRDVEVLDRLTVREVMQTDSPTLRESDTLDTATALLEQLHSHGLPVVDAAGDLVGIITLQDIAVAQSGGELTTVGEACTRELLVAYPDESIGEALRRMSVRDIGRLPVVDPSNPQRLLGVLRRSHVIRAYDVALTKRAAQRHQAQQVRLGSLSDLAVVELPVKAGAPCVDQRVSGVAWPRDCVVASIRRGRQMLIPHGDTTLHSGDVLVVVAEGEALEAVRRLCSSP